MLSQVSLAHLRFPSELTRGRRYPELPHAYRAEFERDRDRIVHARAFRRLEDKTQVFTPGISDHFRNRLTHTIEVSQISRTVASALGLNETLAEALALAHDVGHPPFAHSGEEELNRNMMQYGSKFDHNLHSLRIVEIFEQRYARFPGLNLTFETREGILKHSRDYEAGEVPEADEYLPGLRPLLEAQMIDLTDEIAYNTADLDDGYAAGMFRLEDISNDVPHFANLYEIVETQFAGASDGIRFYEALRLLIDWLTSGFIEGTFLRATRSGAQSPEEVRHLPERIAGFSPAAEETNAGLKVFLRDRVYFTPVLVEERKEAAQLVGELFRHYVRHPEDLPRQEADSDVPLHRRVCDYIAGMTDGFCRRTHAQLTGAESLFQTSSLFVRKFDSSADRTP